MKALFTNILGVLLLVFSFAALNQNAQAQTTQDTIDYPFFIEMMQDRSVNFYQTQRAADLYFNNRPRTKGDGWKPYKRWEWNAQNEIDANGNFPNTVLQDATAEMMRKSRSYNPIDISGMISTGGTCNNSGVWKPMGPTNLPSNNTGQLNGLGRLNAVAVHPSDSNTIFAGAAAGGIWKTTNGGTSWQVYSDSLPSLGVSAIAIDPDTPNTMYFGSGDRDAGDALGRGVFKSTDGGSTWVQSNTGMGNREVGRLIIDPSNTSTLLAACDNGIYRSTNSGGTWTRTLATGWVKEIIFMPGNSNVAYAERGGRFYRTLDNGLTWSLITNGLPTTARSRGVIEVSALDSTLVYFWVANGRVNRGFYLSRDSGATFTTMSTTPNIHDYSTAGSGTGGQAWYNKDMAVDIEDAGVIYAAGVNIFKSTDTGKTWTISAYWVNTVHADNHELIADPITKRIYSANDGGLYYTDDGGSNWTDISDGLEIAQIYKIGASRTQKDVLIAGFQDNGTGNFNNGWYTSRGGDGMDCEVDQEDSRYSYGALYYGSIFRVFNVNSQGTIAANGTNGITEAGGWVTPYTLREGLSSTMYIGYKNIWRSTNVKTGTPTWTKVSNNIGGVNNRNMTEIENAIGDPDILYISRSNGQLWRSDNINAATPAYTQLTQPVGGTVTAIETDPDIASAVYIGIGNRVYRSLNKGGAWTQVSNNLPSNVRCILLDTSSPVKGIYVGTQRSGLWYTDTTSSTWTYFSAGLPPTVNVSDLELYYEADEDCKNNTLYASTYNRGVWHSSTYHDGTQKPVAKVESYDTVVCSSGAVSLNDNSCNVPTEWLWEFSPNTATYIQGDSTSENIVVSFSAKGNYQFIHYAKNCNGYDSTIGTIIVGDTVKSACIPTTTNNWNSFGIFNFQLAQINRTSAGVGGEGKYVDVSCSEIASVKKGETYNVSATTSSFNDEQVKIWVDFNNDGDFVDSGELIWTPARARTNHSGTVTIPNTATTSEILRMRVRTDYLSIASTNPCGNANYGQAEDYGLFIEPDSAFPKFVLSDTIICGNKSITITDSTVGGLGKEYTWNFGMDASPATSNTTGPFTVNYSSPGYKKITLYVGNDSLIIDSAVRVLAYPEMSISILNNDSSLCVGEALNLTALDTNASSATYQWQLNGIDILDSTRTHYSKVITTASDSGNYRIIATSNSCTDTSSYLVTHVHPNPLANFDLNTDTTCFNGHIITSTNNSSISNGTSLTYLWDLGNGNRSFANDSTFSYNMEGKYNIKLNVSSINGCVDSIESDVLINPSPNVSASINDSAQCLIGNAFNWTNNSSISSGTLSFIWNFGDANTSTSNSPTHIYNNISDSFAVWLKAESNLGCADSILSKVVVHPMPEADFTVTDSAQCFDANNYMLANNSSVASGRTLASAWSFGDGNTSVLENPNHQYTGAGTNIIKLISTSSDGCLDSIEKTVTVDENTNINFTFSQDSMCFEGHQINITNTSYIGSGTYNSNWNYGDGRTSSSTNPAAYSYAVYDTVYNVQLITTTDKGCSDTLEKQAYLFQKAETNFTISDSSQCLANNSFDMTNVTTITKGTFENSWNFGDGNTSNMIAPSHTYNNSNDFTIKLITTSDFGCIDSLEKVAKVNPDPVVTFTVNDSTQCFNENNFLFTNNSINTNSLSQYSWTFGDGQISSMENPNISYGTVGNFTTKLIVTTDKNCKDSISVDTRVTPSPSAILSVNDSTQCLTDNSFTFTQNSIISSGNYSYNLDYGDGSAVTSSLPSNKTYTLTGNYIAKLIATSDEGCTDEASQNITVYEVPTASFTINDSAQCLVNNNFISSDNSTNVGIGFTRNWFINNNLNAETGNILNSNFGSIGNNNIKLIVTTSEGCTDSLARQVTISNNPEINISGPNTVCLNDSITLIANSADPATVFAWNTSNGQIGNSSNFRIIGNSIGILNIDVKATNTSGCETDSSYNSRVTVQARPIPVIDTSVVILEDGIEISFKDATGIPVSSRLWEFIPSATGNNAIETFNLKDTATYISTLTLVDNNGCEGSTTESFFFVIPNNYFIPNAFSPNDDGLNDVFKIPGYMNVQNFTMLIFNRWGEMVYTSDNPNEGWDGKYQGEFVMDGTYTYFIQLLDFSNKKVIRKGVINILR